MNTLYVVRGQGGWLIACLLTKTDDMNHPKFVRVFHDVSQPVEILRSCILNLYDFKYSCYSSGPVWEDF